MSGAFKLRDVTKVIMKLRSIVSTTTRNDFRLSSGVVLDGPIGVATGQAGTQILYALLGARVLCAKVGARAALNHEWNVSQVLHGGTRIAPAVVLAEALEDVPGRDLAALLLPIFPLSLADAAAALPSGVGPARNAIALSAAICGLAAVASFAAVGWAHGDIKPSNIMLSGSATGCVVIDFGTARKLGGIFSESSNFSLNEQRLSSVGYDLVCLGSTLAMIQHELFPEPGVTTRESLLAKLSSGAYAETPASIAAVACLELGARTDINCEELLALASRVVDAAKLKGLAVPALEDVWPREV